MSISQLPGQVGRLATPLGLKQFFLSDFCEFTSYSLKILELKFVGIF